MELNTVDRESHTWRKIRVYCEQRLSSLRLQNDTKQSEEATNFLRGQIQEMKVLLSFDKSERSIQP